MAYPESHVIDVLADIDLGRGGDRMLVQLIEQGGRYGVDVRRWYRDDDGEMQPTSKGVRISAMHAVSVASAIAAALKNAEVKAWTVEQAKSKLKPPAEVAKKAASAKKAATPVQKASKPAESPTGTAESKPAAKRPVKKAANRRG